jgi:hypothetical protein
MISHIRKARVEEDTKSSSTAQPLIIWCCALRR